jgi:hypothetical protein
MSETRCSCDRYERLEGATVPAYISAFLAANDAAGTAKAESYRCRWCDQEWQRHLDHDNKRPSLIRIKTPSKNSG